MKQRILFLAIGLSLILCSCDKKGTGPDLSYQNHAPQIVSLSADTSVVQYGETLNLSCAAYDPDQDLLDYGWFYSGGTLFQMLVNDSTTVSSIKWKPPDVSDEYAISVYVGDAILLDSASLIESALVVHQTINIQVNPARPDYPYPRSLQAEVMSNTHIWLTWEDYSTFEDGFVIERKEESGAFQMSDTLAENIEEYDDQGLTPFTSYTYRIYAYNVSGNSNYSNQAGAFTALTSSEGLIAYYPFDGNTLDESGNENHGTGYGVTLERDRFGEEEKAYYFNGASAYLELPNTLLEVRNFTFTAWINWLGGTLTNQPALLAKTDEGSFMRITPEASGIPPAYQFSIFDGMTQETVRSNSLPPFLSTSQWIFIAVTLKGNSGTLYKNAEGVGEGAVNIDPVAIFSGDLGIGGTADSDVYFKGYIDDVRFFDRALEEIEIQSLFYENGWSQ